MRCGILGDIHGNWEALSAVLRDAWTRRVDCWASVGDIVGYNPDPLRCLDRIRELGCAAVRGNHDHFSVNPPAAADLSPVAAAALDWTRARLPPADAAFLRELPRTAVVAGFTLVHNTLEPSDDWPYVFGVADAARSLRHQATQLCFHGHTHVPVAFEMDRGVVPAFFDRLSLRPGVRYFVNVGSVGQPRDRDPRAAYVIYDADAREIELRRVAYDAAATQDKIRRAGLPLWLALRLLIGAR